MKYVLIVALMLVPIGMTLAQQDSAEALVSSKPKADMNYRQLMEVLGEASSMMHMGIIRENQQMVRTGADIVLHHPAPNHKPWTIMQPGDQDGFKQSLLAFDKILDQFASRTAEAAAKGDWSKANEALTELNGACISCHAAWRGKAGANSSNP